MGLLGLAVAVAAWIAVATWEQRLAKAKFNDIAGDYATALQHGLDHYIGDIAAVRALYDSSKSVDLEEFDLFTSRILSGRDPLHSHVDKTGAGPFLRITWNPYVPRDGRAAFEAAERAKGRQGFTIKQWSPGPTSRPEEARSEYFPVLYATEGAAASLIGMDLNSEPRRADAIRRAIATAGMATAHDIVLRTTDRSEARGVFVVLPVYRQVGVEHAARRELLGILTETFQMAPLVDAILDRASLPKTVDLYLFAADARGTSVPLYASETLPSSVSPHKETVQKLPHLTAGLTLGDARWELFMVPAEQGAIGYYRAWFAVATIGLILAAVLAYMRSSLRHTMHLEGANRRILQLAQTDNLTGLANRRAFMKQLKMAFAASLRGAPSFAVLYLDIDDFKDVNDTLGHAMGDELLKDVVARLKNVVRKQDVVARFGGDEFAILAPAVDNHAEAETFAARICEALGAPFLIDGHKISVTSSVGIALFSREIASPEAMMVQADLALYGAKDEGRNCYRFHSEDLDRQVHERVRVADELRTAIEHGELELHYQPQVELATGRVTGLEALVRWNHRTRGLLAPAAFISIAERTGAVVPLGNWIFDEACRQLKVWQDEGIAPQVMAVNVSGVQLKSASEFEREIEASLIKWHVDPGNMELELTESVLMEATQKHNATLENLRRLGIRIAIDDFGTGYSSLKYLTTYPVNRLKLAQEFVFRVTVDYRNAAVVRAAIRLAHELGLDVIAEGVETEAQMRFLIGAGCEQAQGYYFSRPVPADQATVHLRAGRIEPASAPPQPRITSAA